MEHWKKSCMLLVPLVVLILIIVSLEPAWFSILSTFVPVLITSLVTGGIVTWMALPRRSFIKHEDSLKVLREQLKKKNK